MHQYHEEPPDMPINIACVLDTLNKIMPKRKDYAQLFNSKHLPTFCQSKKEVDKYGSLAFLSFSFFLWQTQRKRVH